MPAIYQCQMVGYDDHEWSDVPASSAQRAAERHATICDQNSGGTLFESESDKHTVKVRLDGAEEIAFSTSIYYDKVFCASYPETSPAT